MRLRLLSPVLGLSLALAASASAQVAVGTPAQTTPYYPLFGVTAGIAIPIGNIANDHGAGYTLGGLVEYSVPAQAYALRGEFIYQRFPKKSTSTTTPEPTDVNMTSLGATIVYKLAPMMPSSPSPFVTGGIAVYNATGYGTRPGVNAGAGVEIPLPGFSATAETRLHVMIADNKPAMTIPITVGVRF